MHGHVFLTGKVAEFDASSSAVNAGFRRAQYALAYSFQLPKDHELSSIEQQEQIEPLVAQFAQKLRRYQDGQYGTIGYIPSPDWKMDFWGEHYVELLKVIINEPVREKTNNLGSDQVGQKPGYSHRNGLEA